MSFSTGHSPPPSPLPVPLPFSSSPSLTCCPELNLSVTLGLPPKTSQSLPKPRKLKQSQQSEQAQLKHNPKGQTDRKRNRQVCSKEGVITVTPEPDIDSSSDAPFQDWLRGLRHVVEPPAPTSTHDLSCLERAELNSTLALKTRLQSLQDAQFDSQRAIQQTLQKSESTKNRINARATEEVNVSRSQLLFTSLVSVDVQEDQLITQLLQDKLLRAPPSQCRGRRNTKGPSSLFFITSDLLRQKPLSPEEVPFSRKLSTSACPAHSTFDLYRRQRSWETTP
ncbi:unnamed protein product [Oreochromis niloticus]|nr:unnamed protein product [Mustela putorius furo]